MVIQSPVRPLTYDDYRLLPIDGRRHELIGGELLVTPAPNTKHQRVSLRLARLLGDFVEEHRLGEVFAAPYDVVLSPVDVVQPDLVFVSTGRSSQVTESNLQGAPDLVVEIVSDGSRRTDEIVKRGLYSRSGVAEYWVIDPVIDSVKVYRRQGDDFGSPTLHSAGTGAPLTSPLLPGFDLDLVRLFA